MRNAIVLLALLACALIARAFVTGSAWWIGIDDANIYYVYARNILSGHGIVYAPGGELVEGFTSPLWLLLLVVFSAGNIVSVEAASLLLGIVCTFIALWLVMGVVRTHRGGVASWFAVVAILATPGVIDWMMMARLETPLWVLVLAVAGLRMAYGPYDKWYYMALAALPIIRPEGIVLGPLVAVAACYVCHGVTRAVVRPALLCAAIPITSALLLTAVRLAVFGVPLPNTYYAKVSSSFADNLANGLTYIQNAAYTTMWVPILVFVLVMLWIVLRDSRISRAFISRAFISRAFAFIARAFTRPTQTICMLVVAILVLPVLTGGDHFPYARFQMPAVVFIWMLVARKVSFIGWRLAAATGVLVVMNISLPYFINAKGRPLHALHNMLRQEYNIARDGRMEADAIEHIHLGISHRLSNSQVRGSLPRWGVTSAGGTAYAYAGECVDLLGLNNPKMARANARKSGPIHGHSSFNADVFFEQRPDILCVFGAGNDSTALLRFHTEWDSTTATQNVMHGNIVADPRFAREYGFARLTNNGVSIYGFVRRDYPAKAPSVSFAFLH